MATLVDKEKVHWTDPVIETVPTFEMYDPWVRK
jgi:hypothetical protein